ncbi:hypothetical protein SLEP1_g26786 [Rubroshorea leprosula]|uniref:NADH dehydrogenase subunit 1 n=1 Tax=Rubroshorea leprosula TaxID=152421 RepID=A0AAV5JXI9_9ROSI|nr:hypothetical protein SLEP1_g26786 [Rubroshorea leprosula]
MFNMLLFDVLMSVLSLESNGVLAFLIGSVSCFGFRKYFLVLGFHWGKSDSYLPVPSQFWVSLVFIGGNLLQICQ